MHFKTINSISMVVFFITIVFTTVFSPASLALGLSTFRVYLDNENRQYNFVTYNKDKYTQHCKLALRHYEVKSDGGLEALNNNVEPEKSASKWIRFSPKKFSLSPAKSQSIKFQMRRKANMQPEEYRSFLSVDCELDRNEVHANKDRKVALTPRLRHNLPIIVRTGKLSAKLSFEKVKLENELIHFSLKRSGERSIHGRVELIDTRNEKILSKIGLFSIYTETPVKNLSLETMGVDSEYLMLRFKEDKEVGGTISATYRPL